MPKNDGEFSINCIPVPESLEKLDSIVASKTLEEHIVSVSMSRSLRVEIDEEY